MTRERFEQLVDLRMSGKGFEPVKVLAAFEPDFVKEYTRLRQPAFVAASEREMAINASATAQTAMADARVSNAVQTWTNNARQDGLM